MEVLTQAIKQFLETKDLHSPQAISYFDEVKEYTLARKQDVQNFGTVTIKTFNFDFKTIEALDFNIDPRTLDQVPQGITLEFFHDPAQKDLIQNAVNLYRNHPGGVGRMVQRSNLNKMFRKTVIIEASDEFTFARENASRPSSRKLQGRRQPTK